MKQILAGIILGSLFMLFLSPYFNLWNLKDIANELKRIREELEKLNEGIRSGN
jgi:hypothetical protein